LRRRWLAACSLLVLVTGCGGNDSPAPGEHVTGSELLSSLATVTSQRLDAQRDEIARLWASYGGTGSFEPRVDAAAGSCTGLGERRTCKLPIAWDATGPTGELQSAVEGRATYTVTFTSGGCWRARATRYDAQASGISVPNPRKVGFLGTAAHLKGCATADAPPPKPSAPPPAATQPANSADDNAVVAGKSIGKVSLGQTLSEVEDEIGAGKRDDPLLDQYTWNVTGGQFHVDFNHGKATSISTNSSIYRINGVGTDDTFDQIKRALPDWDAKRCPDGSADIRLLAGADGPTTAFLFPAGPGGPGQATIDLEAVALDPPCMGE
jgi:hypothetical protein